MVRIQLIVGTHPNESFSTVVARYVEQTLKRYGAEVITSVHPLGETALGKAFNGTLHEMPRLEQHDFEKKTITTLIEKEKPDFIFKFHCAPQQEYWHSSATDYENKPILNDFEIFANPGLPRNTEKKEFGIEVRAQARPFPKRALRRIRKKNTLAALKNHKQNAYLKRGTSLEETVTKLGLNPQIMGRIIAKTILEEVIPGKRAPFYTIMKRIPRVIVTKAQWEAANKRRARIRTAVQKRAALRRTRIGRRP